MFPEETQGLSSINPIATEAPVPKPLKSVCKSPIYRFMVKVKSVFCTFFNLFCSKQYHK